MGPRTPEPFSENIVDPFESLSTDGILRLVVTPTSEEGRGPAHYRLERAGRLVWESDLPWTLRAAVVTRDGAVAGYAYTEGLYGYRSDLVLVVLAPDGAILRSEAHSRDEAYVCANPPPPGLPLVRDVVPDEHHARVLFVVDLNEADYRGRAGCRVWAYCTATGTRTADLALPDLHANEYRSARFVALLPVPGTPLLAVQWIVNDQGSQSAIIQLIAPDDSVVWTHRIHDEYAVSCPQPETTQLSASDGQISFDSLKDHRRTTFAISRDAGAWSVRELSQAPAPLGRAEPAITGVLRRTRSVALRTPEPELVYGGISSLDIDDRTRIGWISRHPGEHARFVLVDQQGRCVADHSLEFERRRGVAKCLAWIAGDRWIIGGAVRSDHATTSSAWWFDAGTGEATPIDGLEGCAVHRVARAADGFALLIGTDPRSSRTDLVVRCDAGGNRRDIRPAFENVFQNEIVDLDILSDGTLALLRTSGRDAVELRTPQEWGSCSLLLDQVAGPRARDDAPYYTTLRADVDAGIILYEFRRRLLQRIDRHARLRAAFTPVGRAGEPFRLGSYAVDPAGRIWCTDRVRLFRLGEAGRADLVFGDPPPGTMAVPATIALDPHGAIYALESGTGALHVFDPDGTPRRVLRPNPEDTQRNESVADLTVWHDGTVRAQVTSSDPIVVYSPEARLRTTTAPRKKGERDWRPVQGGGWEWCVEAIRRVDPTTGSATRSREILHRPDGGWIVRIEQCIAAPDGSLALLCVRSSWMGFGESCTLCIYAADATGVAAVRLSELPLGRRLWYDGSIVRLSDDTGFTEFSRILKGPARRFNLPDPSAGWHVLPLSRDHVAAWRAGAREVEFYEIAR